MRTEVQANLIERVRKFYREKEPATIRILFGTTKWKIDHIVPQTILVTMNGASPVKAVLKAG